MLEKANHKLQLGDCISKWFKEIGADNWIVSGNYTIRYFEYPNGRHLTKLGGRLLGWISEDRVMISNEVYGYGPPGIQVMSNIVASDPEFFGWLRAIMDVVEGKNIVDTSVTGTTNG